MLVTHRAVASSQRSSNRRVKHFHVVGTKILHIVLLIRRSMDTTTLSSKGQVIIPKAVREQQQWAPGTVFSVVARDGGVMLTPAPLFTPTQPRHAAGCLKQASSARRTYAAVDETQALRRRAKDEDSATKP
jgi:AbrB family looped-hinge helix DNA binding protein